ncbi:hypothetical protein N7470_003948 [Penicillium chermesinum]|nr:hypothetical protein N7470_003948 [Penicillium chermesinum]
MGQRHNRRRTRPRSSQHHFLPAVNQPSRSPLLISSSIWGPKTSQVDLSSSIGNTPGCTQSRASGPVSAPIWHYRYTAWEIRESTQRTDGSQTEQCRLFGGEPGDDDSLCYRMLEFFGGLDYIDP